jgi:hypothetical protein
MLRWHASALSSSKTPVRSPKANLLRQRLIGTLKRECLVRLSLRPRATFEKLYGRAYSITIEADHTLLSSLGPGLPDLPFKIVRERQYLPCLGPVDATAESAPPGRSRRSEGPAASELSSTSSITVLHRAIHAAEPCKVPHTGFCNQSPIPPVSTGEGGR